MKNRVVIIVSNGVADWIADNGINVMLIDIADNGINVMLIDTDNDTLDKDDIEDFNDMIPDWIKEQYIEG